MENKRIKLIKQVDCAIGEDITESCGQEFGVGGLEPIIYIANYADVISKTFDSNTNPTYISNLALQTSPASRFYKWTTVEYVNEAHNIFNNGDNKNWTHSITFKLRGLDTQKRAQVQKLAGSRVVVIMQTKTQNSPTLPTLIENTIFMLGTFNSLRMTASTMDVGPTADILSGYTITLEGFETQPSFEIIPDPAIYGLVTNTPIADFLLAMST